LKKYYYNPKTIFIGGEEMSEYVGKVGKKGELYMPEELRVRIGLNPGDGFLVTVGKEELII